MNQREGLPQHLFEYVSSITPLLNVDVLVCDTDFNFLLTWRHDSTYGPAWHVPGGIVRFKESILSRIHHVCSKEIGIDSLSNIRPLEINQIMNPTRDYRGHFVSILFLATVPNLHMDISHPTSQGSSNGERACFAESPINILPQHRRYLASLNNLPSCSIFKSGNLLDEYSEFSEFNY
mgnify:CR=1 FL=1